MIDWNDDSMESSEFDSPEDSAEEEPEKIEPKKKGPKTTWNLDDSSDSDERGKRVVLSALEKLSEELERAISKLEGSLKNDDWGAVGGEWESLISLIRKSKNVSEKPWYPVELLKFLVDLEDKINGVDKNAVKLMKPKKAHSFNTAKREFKKFLKENKIYEDAMKKYREDPEQFKEEVPEESKSEHDGEDELPWTTERISKKLQDLLKERGKKTYATTQVNEHIRVLRMLFSKSTELQQQLLIRFRIINAMFDTNLGTNHLNINTWKNIYNELVCILDTVMDHPEIILDEDTIEEDSKLPPNVVAGHLLFSLQKLHEEYLKSLQNIDSHSQEYLTRLAHERDFLLLLQYAEKFYQRKKDTKRLAIIALRELDYLFYKRETASGIEEINVPKEDGQDDEESQEIAEPEEEDDNEEEKPPSPSYLTEVELVPPTSDRVSPYTSLTDTVERLAAIVYQYSDDGAEQKSTDVDRQKRRAMLLHIYHLALHDQYSKGRDMLLMTHLPEKIHQARPPEQVLYNRALIQLGLAAFREGRIEDACNCLHDIFQSRDKAKELLAQGITNFSRNQVEKNSQQEKHERKRQMPYHMHINLDVVEGVLLIAGMLIEVPSMALARIRPDRDNKRKALITKYFRKSFDFYNERQLFTGPPENSKETIIVAAKALERGDWKTCQQNITKLDLWKFIHQENKSVTNLITRQIQEQALRTYLITYGQYYQTIHITTLAEMFSLSQRDVHSLVSTLMMRGELHASLDQPSGAIVVHAQDSTPLQHVALVYAEKANLLMEPGEPVGMDTRSQYEKKWTDQKTDNNRNQKTTYPRGQYRTERQFQTKRRAQRGGRKI
jgi:translation initiation factor 3 subunit C